MATLRQDLGPVTAYAYAVSEGYTGTEEEFAEVLANFADSAEQVAADAAQVALDKGAVHDDKEAVDSAEGRVTSAVNTFTTTTAPNAVTAVENAGAAQIGLVEAEGTRQIGLVADKGTEQVGTVSSEGTTQIGLVEAKGAEVIASIPGDYSTLQGDIASTYSSSSTYAVGDYVLYSGQLYRCTTAISTAEAWTSAKWTAVALGDDVTDLKSALNTVNGNITEVFVDADLWLQGYWAIADGSKKTGSDWICSNGYIEDNIISISTTSALIFYVLAYNENSYIGTWNGSTWSTTYVASAGKSVIDFDYFRRLHPNYKYKISARTEPQQTISPDVEGLLINFAIDKIIKIETDISANESEITAHTTQIKSLENKLLFDSLPTRTTQSFWRQGYWGVADGAYTNSTTWVCTDDYISDDVKSIDRTSGQTQAFLLAYESDGTYVGYWASNQWSKNYDASNYLTHIDFESFRSAYPGYKYKLSVYTISAKTPSEICTQYSGIKRRELNTYSIIGRGMQHWANVKLVNHRGYSEVAPENTLTSFKMSHDKGFVYVETDVQFTSDGVPVLLHDGSINRTGRNADGTEISSTVNINDITYAQAYEYDFGIYKGDEYAGIKIPRFEDFIILCKNLGLHPYVELKTDFTYPDGWVNTLLSIIESNGMKDHVSFISFSYALLAQIMDAWNFVELGLNGSANACLELKTASNKVFALRSVGSSIEDYISADVPVCFVDVDTSNTISNLDPYYTAILTNGITPIEYFDQINIF